MLESTQPISADWSLVPQGIITQTEYERLAQGIKDWRDNHQTADHVPVKTQPVAPTAVTSGEELPALIRPRKVDLSFLGWAAVAVILAGIGQYTGALPRFQLPNFGTAAPTPEAKPSEAPKPFVASKPLATETRFTPTIGLSPTDTRASERVVMTDPLMRMIGSAGLDDWRRTKLSQGFEIRVYDYGEGGSLGKVVSPDGVKLRQQPDLEARPHPWMKWLDFDKPVGWRYEFVLTQADQTQRWIPQTYEGIDPYYGDSTSQVSWLAFAARETPNGEPLIIQTEETPEPKIVNW